MKAFFKFILVILAGAAYGQSYVKTNEGCFVWVDPTSSQTKISWNGKCLDGYATGKGYFTWQEGAELKLSYKGEMRQGTFNGQGSLTYANGNKYVGEFEDDKLHGQGTWTSANGDKYVGEFKDGKLHGQGTYTWANGEKYVGEFEDDKLHGQGTWTSANGDKYVGEFKDGKRNGQGTYYYLADNKFKGDKYVGEYKDDKQNGQGTYTFANGDKYVGESKDDKSHGQGTFIFKDGRRWLGEWSDDKFNGRGIRYKASGELQDSGFYKDGVLTTSQKINPNSFTRIAQSNVAPTVSDSQGQTLAQRERQILEDLPACKGTDVTKWSNCTGDSTLKDEYIYKGDFLNGKRHGFGIMNILQPNFKGDKYVGEFKNGTFNGQGTYYFLANNQFKGDMYIGEFKDHKKSGIGSYKWKSGDEYFGEFKNDASGGQGTYTFIDGRIWIGEWSNWKLNGRGIRYSSSGQLQDSGIYKNEVLVTSQYINPNSFTRIAQNSVSPSPSTNSTAEENQLEQERQRLAEERRRLDEEKRQRELAKRTQRINLQVTNTQPNAEGDLTINIQTNADTSSLTINGEELGGRADGRYSVKRVARAGQETRFEIVAKDVYGNADTKSFTVSRAVVESKVTYPRLSPERVKRQPERDAVAVIIGISNYKSLPKADYAKDDAQVFFDYAIRALGVKPGNIKLLMDEQADAEEIYTAFKTWLPARVKSTTDVYVFYSGHGLPTSDGSGLYWLPLRANRDLISKTGILLSEVNNDIQASKPKSVTIFMDACYSGQARGGETLVASARPISLKAQPTTFPSNFTVITASQADQISSSSPDLQHGIFSYYLMRGMEGEADLNKDGKITLDETQQYLSENVGRHARTMNRQQEPQVIGDGSRILVGR